MKPLRSPDPAAGFDAALALQVERDEWARERGLRPTERDLWRLDRWTRAAARACAGEKGKVGVVYARWAERD